MKNHVFDTWSKDFFIVLLYKFIFHEYIILQLTHRQIIRTVPPNTDVFLQRI